MENWYPVYDFQVKFHSFFRQNAWFLDPVCKKSSKIFEFETLFMSGRWKNHTLKGGTSPYSFYMGVAPPPPPNREHTWSYSVHLSRIQNTVEEPEVLNSARLHKVTMAPWIDLSH